MMGDDVKVSDLCTAHREANTLTHLLDVTPERIRSYPSMAQSVGSVFSDVCGGAVVDGGDVVGASEAGGTVVVGALVSGEVVGGAVVVGIGHPSLSIGP